jgi:metal-responsive CopG/Arc/MetJ family transcriptional regulator
MDKNQEPPKKGRPGRKRISLDIPDEIYEELDKQVIKRNCTLTKWIIVAIIQRIRAEKYYE